MKGFVILCCLCFSAALFFPSCSTLASRSVETWEQDTLAGRFQKRKEKKTEKEDPSYSSAEEIGKTQEKLVEGAYSILGKKSLIIRGKQFNLDCTGVVLAVYYYAGIDLAKDFSHYTGNGVNRLYSYLESKGLLYHTFFPQPGDIIFWDNTYDRNEDKLWNDELTHVGMVVKASSWGTIDYIHHNYRKGIILERMNLKEPDVEKKSIEGEIVIINSPMRMRGSPPGPDRLASQLYRQFGKGYETE